MVLFRELKKMIKQACGLENMFGYETTLANQLYLMHIMLGRIYSTKQLHWLTKFVYFVPNFIQICVLFIICAFYCIYDVERDLILMTHIAFFNTLLIYLTVIVPLASCAFGDSIDTMIYLIDRLLIVRTSLRSDVPRLKGMVNIRTSLIVDFIIFCIPSIIYMGVGTCDVIVFYDEKKVKNFIYYTTPFPHVDEYGSMKFLLLVNLVMPTFLGFIGLVQMWSIIAVPFIWAAVCHNEVIYICHELRVGGTTRNLKIITKAYQNVARIIKYFRKFYNILCTVTLVQLLTIAIANAYVLLLWDISYLIKIRETAAYLICITMIFQLCSVGEMIDNLTDLMACEIYSTDWYHWPTQHRQNIHIFLCQARASFDLSAFKVYPFGLNTVLRFASVVYNVANFLRKKNHLFELYRTIFISVMVLFREVKNLIKQACGLENIFGYRSTLANQLYLMHIMLGRIYSTNKLHWQTKFAYFVPNCAQLCILLTICALYCFYGVENDLILMTQIAFLDMLMIYLTIIIPLASCMFGDSIDIMVDLIDRLLIERTSLGRDVPRKGIINIRTSLIVEFSVFCIPMLIYMSVGTCDVLMFYDEKKVKNYIYYTTPFPHIHRYGSLEFLLFVNLGMAFFVGFIAFIQLWSIIAVPFIWAAVCHNEVIYICHELRVDGSARNLKIIAEAYQKVARIIKNFREFYNILCTVTLVQLLAVAIANAYVVLLWDISYLIKIRGTAALLVCITMVFQLCSVGEMIDNLTNLLSYEIYSTRWYHRSTQHRQNIQIFLCQAQTSFDLSAFKVYPFGLNTVLRFTNMVYNAANFLRRVTQK